MSNTAIRADQWMDFARAVSPERETESPDCRRILPFPAIHTRSAPQMGGVRIASGAHLPGGLVVERVLGRGSIGVVVSAITPRPHRRVAVKLLSNEWALDDEQRRRLLREARAVTRLSSPHVARVLDVGMLEDGAPFLVLEYLEGRALDAILAAEGPLSICQAIVYVLEALDALAEAHHIGLVHRDVKSGNLFLSEREGRAPRVKVLDFGLVKDLIAYGRLSRLTMSGTSLGTPAYMAPEQLCGGAVGPSADVWAIGTTLFELLTGDVPFAAPSIPTMITRILQDPAPRLRSIRADASRDVERVIAWCLEKDPAHRPANGEALMRALERCVI